MFGMVINKNKRKPDTDLICDSCSTKEIEREVNELKIFNEMEEMAVKKIYLCKFSIKGLKI